MAKPKLAARRAPKRTGSRARASRVDKRYGFAFPDDLYAFYDFAKQHREILSLLEIDSAGPLDVLGGKAADPRSGWPRYYNDPPEFFTVLTGASDGLHWGYWFDAPGELAPVIASYHANDAFELGIVGTTLFDAVLDELAGQEETWRQYLVDDPEYADSYREKLDDAAAAREALKPHASKTKPKRKVNAATRSGMGIVVPKRTYRALPGAKKFEDGGYEPSAADLKKLTAAALAAVGDGFPGTALELGHDLWIYRKLRDASYEMLELAYTALDRPILASYLKSAAAYRVACDAKRS